MMRSAAFALSLSIATAPAFAQKANAPNVEESVANPCMVAQVAMMKAEFESSSINRPKNRTAAQIQKEYERCKGVICKSMQAQRCISSELQDR